VSRHSNYMVRSHLRSLDANASELQKMIGPQTNVDEWARTYMATADDRLNAVHDYMAYRDLGAVLEPITKKHVMSTALIGGAATAVLYFAFADTLKYKVNRSNIGKAAIAGAVGGIVIGGAGTGLYHYQRA